MSDNFKWTNELVAEYGQFYHSCFNDPVKYLGKDCLKDFKKQKEAENANDKEYEILKMGVKNLVSDYTNSDLQKKMLDFGYPINSIKRLSDGEVFSIGDTLDEMEIGENVITGFFANFKGNSLWVSTNNERGYGCSLGVANKNQKALFTTEDGVDIFSWFDVVWHVDKYWYVNPFQAGGINIKESKCFSKEEKAIDYIIENKPVNITYKELYAGIVNQPLANIKDFFKSKINP